MSISRVYYEINITDRNINYCKTYIHLYTNLKHDYSLVHSMCSNIVHYINCTSKKLCTL